MHTDFCHICVQKLPYRTDLGNIGTWQKRAFNNHTHSLIKGEIFNKQLPLCLNCSPNDLSFIAYFAL